MPQYFYVFLSVVFCILHLSVVFCILHYQAEHSIRMLKAVAWGPRLLKHSSGVQCTCRNTSSGVHAETQWSIKADHQNATQCCKNTKKLVNCTFQFATQFGGLTMSSRHTDTALKCNRMPQKHQTNCKLKVGLQTRCLKGIAPPTFARTAAANLHVYQVHLRNTIAMHCILYQVHS